MSALLVASPSASAAGNAGAAAKIHYAAILSGLARVDKDIDAAIAEVKRSRQAGSKHTTKAKPLRRKRLHRKIVAAHNDKFRAAESFPDVLGLTYPNWIGALDCIDTNLAKADTIASHFVKNPKLHALPNLSKIGDSLKSASSCAESIVGILQRDNAPETGLISALGDLAAGIDAQRNAFERNPDVSALRAPIQQLQQKKLAIVGGDLFPEVFGIPFEATYKQLDCVDVQLSIADLLSQEPALGGTPAEIQAALEAARACKQTVERTIRQRQGAGPPPPLSFDSDLSHDPQSIVGRFEADVEYWVRRIAHAFGASTGAHAAQAGARYTPSATVPVDGTITSITVKGYAISGDRPGPGGSEPIRFSVARPQPNGQLQVITTTNPPFTLPGTPGTYTFPMSQVSFKCCRVKAGDYISLDARGGEFAVFASVPGSETDVFSMAGLTQNPGYMWIGTPHQDVELLMQVTEQPD